MILDGKAIAAEIRKEIAARISPKQRPKLAVLLCDDNPASVLYVNKKVEACKEVGIDSFVIRPFSGKAEIKHPQQKLLQQIDDLNGTKCIHGILVQLPLPKGIDPVAVFDRMDPKKDVDVLHPENVGLLMQGRPRFVPCTPHGIQQLLRRSGIEISGKTVAIVNRSNIVGKPLCSLLIQDDGEKANATVTVCHDRTPPETLNAVCKAADIVVVAVGIPNFVTEEMVSDKTILVDVGINRNPETGKVCGDADPKVYQKIKGYSPVPNGVGPLTVSMLLHNTERAATLFG